MAIMSVSGRSVLALATGWAKEGARQCVRALASAANAELYTGG